MQCLCVQLGSREWNQSTRESVMLGQEIGDAKLILVKEAAGQDRTPCGGSLWKKSIDHLFVGPAAQSTALTLLSAFLGHFVVSRVCEQRPKRWWWCFEVAAWSLLRKGLLFTDMAVGKQHLPWVQPVPAVSITTLLRVSILLLKAPSQCFSTETSKCRRSYL